MSKSKRISSVDVAREAGVSQATVSYVLNNTEGIKIKPETREAVLQAAKKLNYHTNHLARGMRISKSMSIGVVSDKNMSSFIFMNVLEGIRSYLVKMNYSITLCTNSSHSDDISDADYIKYYNSNIIDGIIFAYANLSDKEQEYLIERDIPFVAINAHVEGRPPYHVKTNIWDALSDAISHLSEQGRKKIAYIGTSSSWEKKSRRYLGFLNGLKKHCIEPCDDYIFKIDSDESGYDSALDAYFKNKIPDAIITDSVSLGFYVIRCAAKNKINIPDDISVIAIGLSQFARRICPSLSTIEAPLFDMGVKGCELLFDRLNENIKEDVIVLHWNFVKRESC